MKTISQSAERRRCPFCGALVFIDEAQQTIHHESPACRPYLRKMRELGTKQSITVVDSAEVERIGKS